MGNKSAGDLALDALRQGQDLDDAAFTASAKKIGAQWANLEKRENDLTVVTAMHVYYATSHGLIGRDAPMSQVDYARTINRSPARISNYKVLGEAIAKGCSTTDENWGLLSKRIGAGEVSKEVSREGSDKDSIYKVLTDTYDPKGGRRQAGGTGQPNAGQPVEKSAPYKKVDNAVASLRAGVKAAVKDNDEAALRLAASSLTNIAEDVKKALAALDAKKDSASDEAAAS